MGTTYGNPYWDKPKEPPKEPFWEKPKFYFWLTVAGFVAIVAVANGVFWQTLLGAFCVLIITGKIRIIDMETEFPDDPDDYPDEYYIPKMGPLR